MSGWVNGSGGGGGAPSGPAGGALGGSYPNPSIAATLDTIPAPVANVSLNSERIVGLADGSGANDAVTMEQLTAVSSGLIIKAPVRAATVTALPAYTMVAGVITETGLGALPAIDGVTLNAGDRLLLKNGAAGQDNGIYVVSVVGSVGASFVLTRSSDANTSPEVTNGMSMLVDEGTTLADTVWTLTTENPITLNTTPLVFNQTGSAPIGLTAGGSTTKAVADTSTHTSIGDAMIWNGSAWVDYVPVMQQRGFVAWNGDPLAASVGTVCVTQSLYVLKVWVPYNISVTNIVAVVSVAGATLTASQNLAILWNQAGTLQGSSADQSAVWTTAGIYSMPVGGGPYAISGGPNSYCYVGILSNGTTPASFRNFSAQPIANAIGSGAPSGTAIMFAKNGSAVTSAASITPSANSIAGALPIWVGLS